MYPMTPDLWKVFLHSCSGKGCAIGLSRPGERGRGKDCFSFVGRLKQGSLILLRSAFPGAQALECYSCVQRADDGCSSQKTKVVKCAPGMEVCTEAVGALETSEWGALIRVPTPSSSSSRAPPPYSPAPPSQLGHTPLSSPIRPFQSGPGPSTPTYVRLRGAKG